MFKEAPLLYKLFSKDILRITSLILLGFLLLGFDSSFLTMLKYALGLTTLLVAASHILRKLLFKHIDLESYSRSALQDGNIAAALVFMSVCFILGILMLISALAIFTH